MSRALLVPMPTCGEAEAAMRISRQGATTSSRLRARYRRDRMLRAGARRVGQPGIEPGTSVLSGLRSNRLSYWPGGGAGSEQEARRGRLTAEEWGGAVTGWLSSTARPQGATETAPGMRVGLSALRRGLHLSRCEASEADRRIDLGLGIDPV